MDDIKILPNVSIPSVKLQSVCMPVVGNRITLPSGGGGILDDLKSHMLGWYDIKRQGCTNESLTANPVLEDLSGNNHPLELKNFVFGGLSGTGGYGTDLTKWINYSLTIPINKYSVDVPTSVVSSTNVNFALRASNLTYFRAKCSIDGIWRAFVRNTSFRKEICKASSGESVDVYFNSKDFDSIPQGELLIYFDSRFTGYTIEILPNFPNSLVFNGVTPKYVINRDNVTLNNNTIALGINKFKLTGNGRITKHIRGNVGQPLNVTIPSFMVRVTGIKTVAGIDKRIQIKILDNVNSENKYQLVIRNDGTYIIPGITYTIEPTSDTFMPIATIDANTYQFLAGDEYELEFLPNYPETVKNMYGIIPGLELKVKCMMMDFVPIDYKSNNDVESTRTGCTYFSIRKIDKHTNYNLMSYADYISIKDVVAYNIRNENGTYINGIKNINTTVLNLIQKRQTVSVNSPTPPDATPYIANLSNTGDIYISTMALNSLILFDRELTEEEMKLVMDKLMMYQDVDNIAAINHDIALPVVGIADADRDLD